MLHGVSDSLFEFLLGAFPESRSYTRRTFEQDPMPPLVAHYLNHTLQHRLDIEVEHLRSGRTSWFDYDDASVQHAYGNYVTALAQHSRIPAEEWRVTLKRACRVVIAHLVIPVPTLAEFTFRGDEQEEMLAPLVSKYMSYFAAYPYLKEAVETFIQRRKLETIDKERFSSLLMQIDRHMTAEYTTDEWLKLLRPTYDLMMRVPNNNKQGAPIELLMMFFGEKERMDIQSRLRIEKEERHVTHVDEARLRLIIDGSVEPFIQYSYPDEPDYSAEDTLFQTENVQIDETMLNAEEEDPNLAETVFSSAETIFSSGETVLHNEEDALDETVFSGGDLGIEEVVPPRMNSPFVKRPPEEAPGNPITITPAQGNGNGTPLWQQFQKKPGSQPAEKPPQETLAEQAVEKTGARPDEKVPLWQQFAKKSPDVPPSENPVSEQIHQQPAPERTHEQHTPLPFPPSTTEFDPYEAVYANNANEPLAGLEVEVLGDQGPMNREMFIESLFGGSQESYERLLRELKRAHSWEYASQLIAEYVFKRNHINIYSPAAVLFTESVEERYRTV